MTFLQVCLFGGTSSEDQLGDTWILDLSEQPRWQMASVAADLARAWHRTCFVQTDDVSLCALETSTRPFFCIAEQSSWICHALGAPN